MPRPRSMRRPLPARHCEWCHTLYVPYRAWQRTCSHTCREALYHATHQVITIPLPPSGGNLGASGTSAVDKPAITQTPTNTNNE